MKHQPVIRHEVEAIEDPDELLEVASSGIRRAQKDLKEFGAIRARAATDLYGRGQTHKQIADRLEVSTARVSQMLGEVDESASIVIKAWARLEGQLHRVNSLLGNPPSSSAGDLISVVETSGILDERDSRRLRNLLAMRNDLLHSESAPPLNDAESAASSAIALSAKLELAVLDLGDDLSAEGEDEWKPRLEALLKAATSTKHALELTSNAFSETFLQLQTEEPDQEHPRVRSVLQSLARRLKDPVDELTRASHDYEDAVWRLNQPVIALLHRSASMKMRHSFVEELLLSFGQVEAIGVSALTAGQEFGHFLRLVGTTSKPLETKVKHLIEALERLIRASDIVSGWRDVAKGTARD